MAEIQGSWNPQFDAVASTLAASLDAGTDVGASVTVMVEGEPVVDIWGGWVDEAHSAPWAEDTITNVWSTTKTMTFLSALMLADRGELDFHAPVATYWPEFATAGKEAVEVRHLMSHTAGLPGWQGPMVPEDLADWDKCVSYLAAQEPWWEPGTVSGYHAVTQGYLIGEVVRRITGQSMGTFFAKEIAEPLGADFFIGLPESEESRVSLVIPPPPLDLENLNPPPMAVRALTNPFLDASYPHERWWRAAEIPAANGQGNARSVARIQSIIAGGGEARGIRLLSEAGVERLFDEQIKGQDLVLGNLYRFGLGYGLSSDMMPIGPRACFWGGYGGSLIIMDLDTRLTVCYVMNRMEQGLEGDVRGFNLVMAAVLGLAGG